MAEQAATSTEADPWAAALAEQAVAPAPAAAQNAGDSVFKPLNKGAPSGNMRDLEMVMNIPVKLTVELGRTRITIKQLLELAQGSVIELEGLAGEPMDILINGYLIAQGEVVVVDDKYGIRITEIITPSERVQKLNR
nr:flagellar motor switch protein FliN [Pseudomonas guangdongensis]